MKILWLTNIAFSTEKVRATASWLQPLAEKLSKYLELVNITDGDVAKPYQHRINSIRQWVIPIKTSCYGQEASLETCRIVESIIKTENPDIVHIWGTEKLWASIYRKGYIRIPAIIDIQGLLAPYSEYYYGGLSFREIIKSIHLKEVLLPWRTLFRKKGIFRKRGLCETDNIKSFQAIAYQSEWVKNYLQFINPSAKLFPTRIMLREAFYKSEKWEYRETGDAPIVFSTCSAAVTYKGIHIIIKAIALLKGKYPDIRLVLVGNINVGNRLLDGYSVFLNNLIRKYNLTNNVVFLGSLDETQIIHHLQQANVCVIPSFIETYCLAFAEAMMVGTPTIATYSGAMPELAMDGKEALFYNAVDYYTCATLIDKVIQNRELSERLSGNGRRRRMEENDMEKVVETQLKIYSSMVN